MSRLGFVDRLQTIAVTATLTSAAWIVAGTVYVGSGQDAPRTAPAGSMTVPVTAAQAAAPAATGESLAIPVAGVRPRDLTDTFADDRGGRRHEAIDIMAPAGTPVIAAAPGVVARLFRSDDGGNTVYVRSNDRRTIHYYAHLRDYAPDLKEGQAVRRGQPLGTVGSTGNADPAGPHLHFAVMRTTPTANWWEAGEAINPYPLLVVSE